MTTFGAVLLAIVILTLAGCHSGPKFVKHPDASMCIMEVKCGFFSSKAKVAVWSKERKKLVEYGWIPLDDSLNGWTLTDYDWSSN